MVSNVFSEFQKPVSVVYDTGFFMLGIYLRRVEQKPLIETSLISMVHIKCWPHGLDHLRCGA